MSAQTIRMLARKLIQSKRPLVLAEGLHCSDPRATDTATIANLLCSFFPGSRSLLDFGDPSSLGMAAPLERIKDLNERLLRGEVDLLLLDNVNPLFNLPPAWEFQKALKSVPMIVTFSSAPDETSEQANLILPAHTFFESWDDYSPRKSVQGLLQPTMGPIFNSRPFGDILISTGKKLWGEKFFPWKDFYEMLRDSWSKKGKEAAAEAFWQQSMQRGGLWGEQPQGTPKAPSALAGISSSSPPPAPARSGKSFYFVTYPTIQFFDGRSANRPFLQELPDPVTQITWGGWIEINPDTARQQGIEKGDVLKLRSPHGALEAPAFPYPGIPAGVLAMPIGQGHTSNGRYTRNESGNPVQVIPPVLDSASGGLVWSASEVTIEKTGKSLPVANVDGSMYQHDRHIVEAVSWQEYRKARAEKMKPQITMPLPEGWDKKIDFYPPHWHDIRWVMVVDLDRCIGCGACVVACYAENNVACGREGAGPQGPGDVLAPRRTLLREGRALRCAFCPCSASTATRPPASPSARSSRPTTARKGSITRFTTAASEPASAPRTAPIKYAGSTGLPSTHPEPMHWQLNPDVTVRMKGVMEKCSFCIQRIVEAKTDARSEQRKLRDRRIYHRLRPDLPG